MKEVCEKFTWKNRNLIGRARQKNQLKRGLRKRLRRGDCSYIIAFETA
jgi:hypothetical protein